MPFRGQIGAIVEVLRNDGELSLEWQIEDFLTLSSAGVDFYDSPEFSLLGEQWFLRIWPSGMTWFSFDWVELHLFRKAASGPRQTLDVSVGIRAEENKKGCIHDFASEEDDCGWPTFCLRSTLQDRQSTLMPDGLLTIACDVKRCGSTLQQYNTNDVVTCEEAALRIEAYARNSQSSEEQDVTSHRAESIETEAISERSQSTENQAPPLHRHGSVIRSMKALLREGRRSDFRLILGGRQWALHKMILESRSPYFADRFLGDWAESAEGEVPTDDLIKEDALDSVLHFIYTGEVEDVYVEDLCDLYVAADRCQMEDLKPLCVDSMRENMCSEIVCRALAIAKTYNEDGLRRVALDHLVQQSETIFDNEEWEKLKQEHPGILGELVEESTNLG